MVVEKGYMYRKIRKENIQKLILTCLYGKSDVPPVKEDRPIIDYFIRYAERHGEFYYTGG